MKSRLKSFNREPAPTGYAPEIRTDEFASHAWKQGIVRASVAGWCVPRPREVFDRYVPDFDAAKCDLQAMFIRLRDQWRIERGPESSTPRMVLHPSYQMIIGMGPSVIPFLLKELESKPDQWFWALQAITQENPVPPESRGNWAEMAKAWIAWGSRRNIR